MKIVSIVGARPQFIKLAPICRALNNDERQVEHIIIHTGQHYDENMSAAFFDELNLPKPNYNLSIGSGTHAEQTGKALLGIESILLDEKPDHVIVFGDTNATLSGVLAASKLGIPISHIEAGLRSFNRSMPEELNRIIADRLSTLLFCPNDLSVQNLRQEGRLEKVFQVGDVMVDQIYAILSKNNLKKASQKPYVFMTLHRQETSTAINKLKEMLTKINDFAKQIPIYFAVHPRMKQLINSLPISYKANFKLINPLGYEETILKIKNAACVLTDSGGIQKESYLLKTPCITLRNETEWIETLENKWNRLVGLDVLKLEEAFYEALVFDKQSKHEQVYGDGNAAIKIIEKILNS